MFYFNKITGVICHERFIENFNNFTLLPMQLGRYRDNQEHDRILIITGLQGTAKKCLMSFHWGHFTYSRQCETNILDISNCYTRLRPHNYFNLLIIIKKIVK